MPELLQPYTTVRAAAEAEFVERRSRFIGQIAPAQTEAQALSFIQQVKASHWDANHNVYAYCLRQGQLRRYSDDGEPQGTAGIPVLEVLTKSGVTDAVLVVTRYFGGVLLGAGGLVRAYSHGGSLALQAAGTVLMRPCAELELESDYALYGKIARLLPRFGAKTLQSDFGAAVTLRVLLAASDVERFADELRELTADLVQARPVGERFDEL